ncbi:MAG: Uma2 family endonuclease [Xenococcaceae cyanobacterium MO_188.B19]|nr:Uma2 family endonuclease [Xenococcaceae cyanobacterium MO_188.B19]
MLVTEKLHLNLNKIANQDQVLILTGTTWEDFEQLTSEEYLGYRASYKDGEIVIVSPGRNHERISRTISALVIAYCRKYNKPCYPFGSTTLKNPPLAAKEPDTAFAIDTDKDTPDVAIEVIFSSGSIADLEKYKMLGIKEVWLWQQNQLTFYQLLDNDYQIIPESNCFPKLKSSEFIEFVNRGLTDDILSIEKNFLENLKN